MKKTLLITLATLILFASCSSTRVVSTSNVEQTKKNYEVFDSCGYVVNGEDLDALAEVLYASNEFYGSYRLFDTIGIDTKALDKSLHFDEYRKQWTRIKSGLNVYFDYSENPDMYYFFYERQIPGTYSTIPLGSIGPAGGYVFYDKGKYSDGWRFLEAAPRDLNSTYMWGDNGSLGTSTGIGTGKKNTETIAMKSTDRTNNAAKACLDYNVNGYDDWFLPSKDELNLMYMELQKKGLDSFAAAGYWSSSEGSYNVIYGAWRQAFTNGNQSSNGIPRYNDYRVRPVRAF